jgi:hypothetical protein
VNLYVFDFITYIRLKPSYCVLNKVVTDSPLVGLFVVTVEVWRNGPQKILVATLWHQGHGQVQCFASQHWQFLRAGQQLHVHCLGHAQHMISINV